MDPCNQKFPLALWRFLGEATKNEVVSPVSILAAFSMVLAGARTHSEVELKQALQVDSSVPNAKLYSSFQSIIEALNTVPKPDSHFQEPQITMANRLFLKKGYQVEKDYSSTLQTFFKSEIAELDFGNAKAAAEHINGWVESITNSKIKDLLSESSFNANTRLVIANAIYFKGNWQHKFKNYSTRPDTFHLLDGKTKEVQMMSQEEGFRVLQNVPDLSATAVELPFEGHRFSLVILVPQEVTGIKSLEAALTESKINHIMENLEYHRIGLTMPKFKVESTIQLNDIVSKLGAKSIFQDTADLSGISKQDSLFVGKAVHKAFLNVNEEGAEAAAATGISIECMCMPLPPEFDVTVDRAFLTWIWDSSLKTMLFVARVASPEI